jgi:hypothetical protein
MQDYINAFTSLQQLADYHHPGDIACAYLKLKSISRFFTLLVTLGQPFINQWTLESMP